LLPCKSSYVLDTERVSLALVIQHAMRMHRLYCHLWPVQLYHILPHYLQYGMIFGKKIIENKMCAFILFKAFV
jgi:hypothetical protein